MTRRLYVWRALALSALLIGVAAQPLLSHDFWLIPNAFRISVGDELIVRGQTSSEFPTSLSAVTADRVERAEILMSSSRSHIGDIGVEGQSLRLTTRPKHEGQAVAAVAIHPRSIPESPESFRNYLTLEGAPEALARYDREGLLPTDSIVRRYAKYAKTLVEVGDNGPRAFSLLADHPLEFVPLKDPLSVAAGGEVRFRMLLFGEPLPHARGHASVATAAEADGAHHGSEFETNADGEFSITVAASGLWNVRALYILPAPEGTRADWDVHWATLVWQTSAGAGASSHHD